MWRAGMLVVGLIAALGPFPRAAAQAPVPSSPSAASLVSDRPVSEHNLLVPLIEIPFMQLSLMGFNALVLREPWTVVTPDTVRHNLESPWVFDNDNFEVNLVGHPYQGSLAFSSARSGGFGFWGSMLAAGLSSVAWEIAGEAQQPSLNDLVSTTVGGAFLGEALHRTATVLLERPGHLPYWLHVVGAAVVDPVGTFNRWILDGRYDAHDVLPEEPVYGSLGLGLNALGSVSTSRKGTPDTSFLLGEEFHVWFDLASGLPGSRDFEPRSPFDHFQVHGELSVSEKTSVALFANGLLWGRAVRPGRTGAGVWGLFGSYDFANHDVLRVSGVGIGPGGSVAFDGPSDSQLQFMGALIGLGIGAAGQLYTPIVDERDYHFGPGGELIADARWVSRESGSVHVSLRHYLISGAYTEPGLESVTYLTFGGAVSMGTHFELVGDYLLSVRSSRYYSGTLESGFQRAGLLRVGIRYRTDEHHGAVRTAADENGQPEARRATASPGSADRSARTTPPRAAAE